MTEYMHQIICIFVVIVGMMICVGVCKNEASSRTQRVMIGVVFLMYCIGNLYTIVLSRNIGYDAQVELMPFHTYFELISITENAKPIGSNVIAGFLEGTPPIVGLYSMFSCITLYGVKTYNEIQIFLRKQSY